MYIPKIITLGATLAIVSCLHGTNPVEAPETSPEQINLATNTEQVNLSHLDPQNYSSMTFTFKVWHASKFDEMQYAKIANQFTDLLTICKQTDIDQTGFDPIIDILGDPFREIIQVATKENGISCSLTINVDNDSIVLELTISHENTYNNEAWLTGIAAETKFLEKEHWIQELSPIFTDAINAGGDESGIHGSLTINLE